VPEVLGQVDGSHPACAYLTFDPVAVGEGYLEAALELGLLGFVRGECLKMFEKGAGLAGGRPLSSPGSSDHGSKRSLS